MAFIAFASAAIAAEPPRKNSNIERLSLARLAAVHADVENLKSERVEIPIRRGLSDYRCIMHAHAEDSTHTGGTLSEMLADAKKAGVNAILLTDHYRPPTDFIDGRWRGLKEGGAVCARVGGSRVPDISDEIHTHTHGTKRTRLY